MYSNIYDRLRRGEWLYGSANDFPELAEALLHCADACHEINLMRPSAVEERREALRALLGSVKGNFVINPPFRCDFGFNIHIGENFIGNFNLTVLDEAEVRIGNNVLIGPNCSLITIEHALTPDSRNDGVMRARGITIGNDVWIATNVTVLPGVTIGDGAVIGAGSVVTHSIPPHTLAAGVPCRAIRMVTDADRKTPQRF